VRASVSRRLSPFLSRIVLVEAGQIAIVAFVQRLVAQGLQSGLPHLAEQDVERALRALQCRGEGDVEGKPLRLELAAGLMGFLHALLGEVDIAPAGEQVFQIPFALAMPHEYEKTVRHCRLLSFFTSPLRGRSVGEADQVGGECKGCGAITPPRSPRCAR
jgi:hypothetical protein